MAERPIITHRKPRYAIHTVAPWPIIPPVVVRKTKKPHIWEDDDFLLPSSSGILPVCQFD